MFVNWFLRTTVGLKWSDKITNAKLMERTTPIPMNQEVSKPFWGWERYTFMKSGNSTNRNSFY